MCSTEIAPTQLLSGLPDNLMSKKTYPKFIQNVNHTKFGHNSTVVTSGLDHIEVRQEDKKKTANPSFGQQANSQTCLLLPTHKRQIKFQELSNPPIHVTTGVLV